MLSARKGIIMDPIDQIIQRKDQEYIDHTLLAPDYMRDPNNFIIDLINFPKPTNTGVNNTDTLASDLQFPNTLFSEPEQDNSNPRKSPHSDYMPLNDVFLIPVTKDFSSTVQSVAENSGKPVQQLLITDNNATLSEASIDGSCDTSRFRKVLPHKKRISRKLKLIQNDSNTSLNLPLESKHNVRFRCDLCGHGAYTQLNFFTHLKQHYEPSTPGTILAAMKTTLDALGPEKTEVGQLCSLNKKTHGLEQVFQDVHFPFENFSQNNTAITPPAHDTAMDNNSTNRNNLTSSPAPQPPLHQTSQSLAPEEFSDTEDMLEGIRDKVFVEDTCDTMDLITPASNDLKPHWFNNSCFIESKAKPFCDVLFNGSLQPLLTNDSENTISVLNNAECAEDACKIVSPKPTLMTQSSTSPVPNSSAEEINLHLTGSDVLSENDMLVQEYKRESPLLISSNMNDSFDNCEINAPTNSDDDEFFKYNKHSIIKNHIMWSAKEESDIIYDNNGKKKFVCKKCQRIFNSSNALKYHHRTHSGLRPHQCDICARKFFALGALKTHIRTHTGSKPYQCEYCFRKFRQWGDMQYHITSIHTDEKAFTCEFCGKSFARKYSLIVHVRIHTSERNYKCEWCDKTFRASSYLQNHRKIHTGEKPYQCDICPKRFRMSGDLKRHQCMHERKMKYDNKKSK